MRAGARMALGTTVAWIAMTAAAAAEPVARSGPLEAHVADGRWGLELRDRSGQPVLSEHPGTGSGPSGTLGFQTLLGWNHATQVASSSVENGVYRAELETTSPLHTIQVELSPAGRGIIALDARLQGPKAGVKAMGMGFTAPAGEKYLGFGERSNQVDQAGSEVENYVADGPYQDEEYLGIQAFVPPWGLRDQRPDATYFPIPWLLSSEGYGVLADNPETSTFRLGTDAAEAWSVEVTPAPAGELGAELAPPVDRLRLRFFAGPTPARALGRFSAAVGRQPEAKKPWLYGPWFQPGNDAEDLAALRAADAPVSVLQTYTHYLPCGEQDEAAERARTLAAHQGGVAITTYFNPMVCASYPARYEPAQAADALTETRAGTPYIYRYGANFDDLFLVGQYDFFEPAGRELYADALLEAVEHGYDGWMEDFGEYTPLDSVSNETIDGTRAHNEYARRYHCTAWNAIRNLNRRSVVRFQRSGWTGAAKCAQVVWGGDPTTGWGFDGLASAMTQALTAGTSGIGIWGSDIGGFFALGFNELTPELLTRWVQFGAVSGVMRTQRNGVALPPRERPQVTDPDQIENWRRYAKLRTQLYPYIAAAEADYRRQGLPLMRHLILRYPRDPQAAASENEFLFGPAILAAPVIEEGATERDVYLPKGRWVDLWRSATYDETTGGLELAEAKILDGKDEVTLPAPLDELPLLVRAGAVIPLLQPDVDTLAKPGADPETVGLGESRRRLRLLAFPSGKSTGAFYRRGTISSQTRAGAWRLKLAAPKRTHFELDAALSAIPGGLEPCSLERNGNELPGSSWSYDPETQVLRASFRGRRVGLAVMPCG